ncbi:MAG TPA: helix-turn-helix domain-containing protein [Caulobacteraceae bacterium]
MSEIHNPPLAATIPEACRLSGLGRSSIYALIGNGQVRSTKIGKRRLVMIESLRSVIEKGASLDAPPETA